MISKPRILCEHRHNSAQSTTHHARHALHIFSDKVRHYDLLP
jgi:hypothetical protein